MGRSSEFLHDKRASETNKPMMPRQIQEVKEQHRVEWTIKQISAASSSSSKEKSRFTVWHNKYTFLSSINALLTYIKIGLNRFNKKVVHLRIILSGYDTQGKWKQHFYFVNLNFK